MLTEIRDLCCDCLKNENCIDRGTAKRPKFHCEEFDTGVQSPHFRDDGIRPVAIVVGGLCCNCMNRTRCAVQPQEGDTWHCEEYC